MYILCKSPDANAGVVLQKTKIESQVVSAITLSGDVADIGAIDVQCVD